MCYPGRRAGLTCLLINPASSQVSRGSPTMLLRRAQASCVNGMESGDFHPADLLETDDHTGGLKPAVMPCSDRNLRPGVGKEAMDTHHHDHCWFFMKPEGQARRRCSHCSWLSNDCGLLVCTCRAKRLPNWPIVHLQGSTCFAKLQCLDVDGVFVGHGPGSPHTCVGVTSQPRYTFAASQCQPEPTGARAQVLEPQVQVTEPPDLPASFLPALDSSRSTIAVHHLAVMALAIMFAVAPDYFRRFGVDETMVRICLRWTGSVGGLLTHSVKLGEAQHEHAHCLIPSTQPCACLTPSGLPRALQSCCRLCQQQSTDPLIACAWTTCREKATHPPSTVCVRAHLTSVRAVLLVAMPAFNIYLRTRTFPRHRRWSRSSSCERCQSTATMRRRRRSRTGAATPGAAIRCTRGSWRSGRRMRQ